MIVAFVIAGLIVATITLAAVCIAPSLLPDPVVLDSDPDAPRPFGYRMAWLAIRSADTDKVGEALGLDEGLEANWNSGIGTVYDDELSATHLFLSPPVDGWTFLIGLSLPHPVGPAFVDKLTPLMMRLGQSFEDVQYFFTYPLIDFFAWGRVRRGEFVRGFAVSDEGVVWNRGRPTAEERALGLRLFELRGVRGRQGDAGGEMVLYPTEEHVLRIARGWGIDPMALAGKAGAAGNGWVVRVPAAWRAERVRKRAA